MEQSNKEAKEVFNIDRSTSPVAEITQYQEGHTQRPDKQPANAESGGPKSTISTQPASPAVTNPAPYQRTNTHTAPRIVQQGTNRTAVPSLDPFTLRIEQLRNNHLKAWWDETQALVGNSLISVNYGRIADAIPIAMLSER